VSLFIEQHRTHTRLWTNTIVREPTVRNLSYNYYRSSRHNDHNERRSHRSRALIGIIFCLPMTQEVLPTCSRNTSRQWPLCTSNARSFANKCKYRNRAPAVTRPTALSNCLQDYFHVSDQVIMRRFRKYNRYVCTPPPSCRTPHITCSSFINHIVTQRVHSVLLYSFVFFLSIRCSRDAEAEKTVKEQTYR